MTTAVELKWHRLATCACFLSIIIVAAFDDSVPFVPVTLVLPCTQYAVSYSAFAMLRFWDKLEVQVSAMSF